MLYYSNLWLLIIVHDVDVLYDIINQLKKGPAPHENGAAWHDTAIRRGRPFRSSRLS